MATRQTLAVKYRPQTFSDVVEQSSVKIILEEQIAKGETKNAYLFCGGAGTGKTTCARLFANAVNKGKGTPIELDAASNNSVDDVRLIIQQSRQKSLDSDYRTFIIDECHSLSNSAWQAFLKILEEPPATAIFIFCTTDPQKIPKTILSRVQRYDFQRISQQGIVKRLDWILAQEIKEGNLPTGDHQDLDAIEYMAKIADGGMRDAITLLDKCLDYSTSLTLENVVKALGAIDYTSMLSLTDFLTQANAADMMVFIENLHREGKDLKLFIKSYTTFVLDLCKFDLLGSFTYTQIPDYFKSEMENKSIEFFKHCQKLMKLLLWLNSEIKWDANPKAMIEANFYKFCLEVSDGTNFGTTL